MSDDEKCRDCCEDLSRRSPGALRTGHERGGIECLKRQLAQEREKNERLTSALVRYGKADLASEDAYVHGREAETALEEENEAAFHAVTELARELADPPEAAAAQSAEAVANGQGTEGQKS